MKIIGSPEVRRLTTVRTSTASPRGPLTAQIAFRPFLIDGSADSRHLGLGRIGSEAERFHGRRRRDRVVTQ